MAQIDPEPTLAAMPWKSSLGGERSFDCFAATVGMLAVFFNQREQRSIITSCAKFSEPSGFSFIEVPASKNGLPPPNTIGCTKS
jgi:hypothetical protein